MDELYFSIMLAASCCMILTGIIMAIVKHSSGKGTSKLRWAKYGLTTAVIVLGGVNMMQIGIDPDGDVRYLGSCIALAISYFQALLFTTIVLVLISPEEVTKRRMMSQIAAILFIDTILIGTFLTFPLQVLFYVYEFCVLLYIGMLVVYTRWYVRCHRDFVRRISDYYEEEEIERSLRWLNRIFWGALTMGVLSLLMIFGKREIDLLLTVVFTVFYAVLAAYFINYELSASIILPALSTGEEDEAKEETEVHPDNLMAWIERGGFLDTQKAVAEIAGELNMSVGQFRQYFRKVVGEDFRTWRVRKRIEHAQKLMEENPEWPATRIAQASGFNDRSYFYQQFQLYAGISITEYRQKLRGIEN